MNIAPHPTVNSQSLVKWAYGCLWPEARSVAVTMRPHKNQRNGLIPPRDIAKTCFRALDQGRLGVGFYKAPREFRCEGFLICENARFDPHFHGVIVTPRSPHKADPADWTEYARSQLAAAYPTADVLAEVVHDMVQWLGYCTKENDLSSDLAWLASDFWPST